MSTESKAMAETVARRLSEMSPERRAVLDRLVSAKVESKRPAAIRPRANRSPCPMSFAQQRMWFLDQMAPGSPLYNIHLSVPVVMPLDVPALERSINEIVRRHESLRTTFAQVGEQPMQVTSPPFPIPLDVIDLRKLPQQDKDAEGQRIAAEEMRFSFDLASGPLLRAALLRMEEHSYVFLLTLHHIVSDGWSSILFFKELKEIYMAFSVGRPSPLPELAIQYADYAVWQRNWLEGETLRDQLDYWKEVLAELPGLRLLTDRPRPSVPRSEGARQYTRIPRELSEALRQLSQREGSTLFMTLMTAFKALLVRYTGQEDIVVGAPIANRNRLEVEGLIGFFVNTLVMRTNLSGDPTFREALKRVREMAIGAYAHQDVPFEKLVEALHPERELTRNPLFQVTFQIFNNPNPAALLRADRTTAAETEMPWEIQRGSATIDLAFDFYEAPDGIFGVVEYASYLFDKPTIERMVTHFLTLLQGVVDNPDRRISELPLMTPQDQKLILTTWNQTQVSYSDTRLVHELFAAQATRTPDAIAVEFETGRLSYGELNARANQLAHYLRGIGVKPDSIVALSMERSPEMLIGLLGVLKSGGAYLPLDPGYPDERLAFMLADSSAKMILTHRKLMTRMPSGRTQVICLDDEWPAIAGADAMDPVYDTGLDDLAYVIYTSGSTGRPKGVMISHRGLRNHMLWWQSQFPMGPKDCTVQKYSLSFDVAAVEIFGVLLTGAKLVLPAVGKHYDPLYMTQLMAQHKVTVIDLVPSYLELLLDAAEFREITSLRRITCGGEVMSGDLRNRCMAALDVELYNIYGPTETTISSTFWNCSTECDSIGTPIGRPISNTQLYILDPKGNPVPTGVPGELCIAGEGLSLGYLNQPEVTKERFVPNPFAEQAGGRMYRTGDAARYRGDGNVEFLGRIDQQVKVRGFRVEPAEIERVLREHPEVLQSVVVPAAGENGTDKLLGYVVLALPRPELWPSVGEYFIYDDLLYHAMTSDEARNASFRTAIDRLARGKVVVDIGTGADVVHALACIDAGAEKVYAIEMLDHAYERAKQRISTLGLEGRVILIHGDSRTVELPERADLCVSELLGTIASSEGVSTILNDAWRFLKDTAEMIPRRATTQICALELPPELAERPAFSDLSAGYVQKIFEQEGRRFDLRCCIKNLPPSRCVSDSGVFEELDFKGHVQPGSQRNIVLTIQRDCRVDGFLLWLTLSTTGGEFLDVFKTETAWLPVFFPTFSPGVRLTAGDTIRATCRVSLSGNNLTPDYRLEGVVLRKAGGELPFDYYSPHSGRAYKSNLFYERIFAGDGLAVFPSSGIEPSRASLRRYLESRLPEYMIPSSLILTKALPLTPSGKVDRRALPLLHESQTQGVHSYVAPRNQKEQIIGEIWKDVLGVGQPGVEDNFFDLGGHSLLLVRVLNRLRTVFEVNLSIIDLFRYPTIGSLANYLAGAENGKETFGKARPAVSANHRSTGAKRS